MADLRDEIVESQKTRADILKWKLIIVASLGGAGLGLTGQAKDAAFGYAYLALMFIPFVCVYVDLLCRHNALRIEIIGAFLRSREADPQYAYEQFVDSKRHLKAFDLEDWVLRYSTIALSALVALAGMWMLSRAASAPPSSTAPPSLTANSEPFLPAGLIGWLFTGSGAAGIGLSHWVERLYRTKSDALKGGA